MKKFVDELPVGAEFEYCGATWRKVGGKVFKDRIEVPAINLSTNVVDHFSRGYLVEWLNSPKLTFEDIKVGEKFTSQYYGDVYIKAEQAFNNVEGYDGLAFYPRTSFVRWFRNSELVERV